MERVKLKNRILSALLMLTMVFTLAVTDIYASSKVNDGSIKLSGVTYPTTVNQGSPFSLRGKLTSEAEIEKVSVGVVSTSTGKWLIKYYKADVNKKTFNIKKADESIRFGKLKKGSYYYRIRVKVKGKVSMCVLNKKFYVEDNKAETVPIRIAESSALKLKSVRAPGTYPAGKEFVPKGTVTANKNIKKVEVGIVMAGTNKWTEYKYTGRPLFTKTFDLSKTESKLDFDRLPGGEYYYRMYVHTADGVKIAFNKAFTVVPSKKAMAAVRWAIKIANNDEFSYGKKPKTSKVGCYFCGTNQKRKPKGYEKTYVCMTFVHAAFAHGAKDPELLKDCKAASHCLSETNTNFSRYSCWFKVGLCKDLELEDLLPGDVICYYSNDNIRGHLCIYAGGNKIVDAEGIKDCWGPNSIAVRNNKAASMLAKAAKFNKKSYVMRYRG